MKKLMVLIVGITTVINLHAQNVATRTTVFQVDLSDPKKLVSSAIPIINWITPTAETNYVGEARYKIKFEIESSAALKNITITIKDNAESASRGMLSIQPTTEEE